MPNSTGVHSTTNDVLEQLTWSGGEPREQERHQVHDQPDLSREYKRER